jgi:hypothetical protein
MLTETEKRKFVFSTLRPMAKHTLPCLTQVVGVIDDSHGEFLGTGFFCRIDGRQAVVTAAHVLRNAAKTGLYNSLSFSRGSGEVPAIVAGKIRYFDEFDLAIYLPERNFPIGQTKTFWAEDRIEHDRERAKTDYLFVQGFPARFSRNSKLLGGLVSETLSSGAMMRLSTEDSLSTPSDPDALPEGLLQSHQLALNFSFEAENFEGPDGQVSSGVISDWQELFVPGEGETFPGQRTRGAYGLSGSPVWRIGASDQPTWEWTPLASRLIGIVTDWNFDHKILIATSATKLFDLLPDL